MKRHQISIAALMALGIAGSANAAVFDTYESLTHTGTESGFVSGSDLSAPYSFDFMLSADSIMSFSGETSLDVLGVGLYSGNSLLRGWLLTPTTGDDATTFALAAGSYSFKALTAGSYGSAALTQATGPGYYAFESSIVSSVPEPESYAIFLAGLGMIGVIARRKLDAAA